MMYDERMVVPMRQELTRLGVEELRTSTQVDEKLKTANGTGEPAAEASMALGNALYNITWFGNARSVEMTPASIFERRKGHSASVFHQISSLSKPLDMMRDFEVPPTRDGDAPTRGLKTPYELPWIGLGRPRSARAAMRNKPLR